MVRGDTNHDDIECKKCKWSVGTQTMETLCLCAFVVKKTPWQHEPDNLRKKLNEC